MPSLIRPRFIMGPEHSKACTDDTGVSACHLPRRRHLLRCMDFPMNDYKSAGPPQLPRFAMLCPLLTSF